MNVELLLKEYVATDTIAGEIISEKHQVKYSCTYVINLVVVSQARPSHALSASEAEGLSPEYWSHKIMVLYKTQSPRTIFFMKILIRIENYGPTDDMYFSTIFSVCYYTHA